MKQHGLYKYVCNGEIIYIGKSNSNIDNRIAAHKSERKFKPYLQKAEVYVCNLPNSTETDILEKVLINHYKPILNGTDNFPGISNIITFKEPNWIPYREQQSSPNKLKPLHKVSKQEAKEYLSKNIRFLNSYQYILKNIDNGAYSLRPSILSGQLATAIDVSDMYYSGKLEMSGIIDADKMSGSLGLTGVVEVFESEKGMMKAFFKMSDTDSFIIPKEDIDLIHASNKYYASIIKQ